MDRNEENNKLLVFCAAAPIPEAPGAMILDFSHTKAFGMTVLEYEYSSLLHMLRNGTYNM